MKKIVITGGLGYIGTELCKIYSGESRFKKIVVIDNKFYSERIRQLSDWGIEYVQGSILDLELMKFHLKDADVVYHLAGITDVAYTKTDSNDFKDKEIKENGIVGTQNVINSINQNCKLIFPSTHVVFEGFKETKFDIDESEKPSPILAYSSAKVQSEIDITESHKNYIIVRLGSVYGLSQDNMRINIMPNLFSKITAFNGKISLFSGGVQYKSLLSVVDVVRAMKYLAESNISNEVFHLSNENMTIKEVAQICKKINPKVEITETEDEIPNLGYTLSNKKLLSTGFKFLYNIEESIHEMVNAWNTKPKPNSLEYKMYGGKEYLDHRGKISNYELTEPINLIGYIESKSGSVRANHYHPIQEQKCLLIKGKYVSVTKDLSVDDSVIETRLINAGDLAVIQPNVAHTMVFLEDSIFLNLVRGEREHDNYGITHTIPYELVDERLRKLIIESYKVSCRSCGNEDLQDVISLGVSPLANNLVEDVNTPIDKYPLEVKYCEQCHNSQLSVVVPPNKMFDNYLYVSSTAQTFRKHFESAANKYLMKFQLNENDLVVDIGSNDGVFLKPISELKICGVGVEPAKNLSDLANSKGLTTYNSYFDKNVVDKILKNHGKAKLVTASNVFAHSDELKNITKNVFELLDKDGTFIIEIQYFLDTLKDLTFDNIYHEHVNFWTLTSLKNFFERENLIITEAEHINTHGGSLRVYVNRKIDTKTIDSSVDRILLIESDFGIDRYDTYQIFASRIHKLKENVLRNINFLKKSGHKISAYGSPAKATTALNFYGIDNNFIDYTIEDNVLKHNKFIPGVNIEINSLKNENLPDIVIVLAWNFFDYIVDNNRDLTEKGVTFISVKELENEKFIDTFQKSKQIVHL